MKKILKFLILTTFTLAIMVFPIFKTSAENPELSMTLFSEQFDGSTGKVSWVITFTSTGIAQGTNVNISLYEDGKIVDTSSVVIDKEGKSTYYTKNNLTPSTKYNIIAIVKNPALSAFLERTIPTTVTDNQALPTANFTPIKNNVINVDTQKNNSNDTHKYTLLAPFVGFTEAPEQIGDYLNKIFILAIGLCVALAVLMMIIAGVQYMGEESIFGKMNAKGQIKNALLGLLIALSAYALLNTIDPRLLGKGGVSVKTVTLQIDNETETIPWSEYASTGNIKMCPSGFVDVKTFSVPAKINVCREIAPQLEALIKKADAAGIKISGYGTRSTAQQKKLRIKNGCPDDTTPSNSCKPPTARPGYSMHESGKAIDFNCNAKSMTDSGGQKSPCFIWLSKNASPLLKNLASEPWHWSTTGQ